jgi:hypothetical protein
MDKIITAPLCNKCNTPKYLGFSSRKKEGEYRCKNCLKKHYRTHVEKYQRHTDKNQVERIRRWRKTAKGKLLSRKIARKLNLKKYGLTADDYSEMLKAQNGKCAICKKPDKTRNLAIDHCHLTGKIRGLLCAKHNMGLGYFDDSISILKEAIEYLKTYL